MLGGPRHDGWRDLMRAGAALRALVLAPRHGRAVGAPGRVRVFVTNEKSDDVTVIDASTRAVIKTIAVGKRPRGVATSPDGRRVYIANSNSDSLSVIDAATLAVLDTGPARRGPRGPDAEPGRQRALRRQRDHGDEPFRTLASDYPEPDTYPPGQFRLEWGPILHWGRFDGSARILMIGHDPAQHGSKARPGIPAVPRRSEPAERGSARRESARSSIDGNQISDGTRPPTQVAV